MHINAHQTVKVTIHPQEALKSLYREFCQRIYIQEKDQLKDGRFVYTNIVGGHNNDYEEVTRRHATTEEAEVYNAFKTLDLWFMKINMKGFLSTE